jgi:hypothetical protein
VCPAEKAGRAIRYIFCSATASQKDAAAIPHTKTTRNNNFRKRLAQAEIISTASAMPLARAHNISKKSSFELEILNNL